MDMRKAQNTIIAASAIAIGAMLVASIIEGYRYSYATSIACLLLLMIPAICMAKDVVLLPWPVVLCIGVALSLHCLGVLMDWYTLIHWWDKLTHLVSGIAVASLAALALIVFIVSSSKTIVPLAWVPFLIIISVLTMEGIWEIFEFSLDTIIGTYTQHSLADTMGDITTNTISGVIAGLGVAYYMSKASLDCLVESMRVDRIVNCVRHQFID